MKIAFVLGEFPALSETFILSQITGLIDRGHEIDIYALGRRADPVQHPDVDRYRLIGRTHYLKVPMAARLRSLASRITDEPSEAWKTVRRRLRASPGQPSFAEGQEPLRHPPARRYDVVHCHFGTSALAALAIRRAGGLGGPLITTFYGADLTRHLVQHGNRAYAGLFKEGSAFLAICDYFRSRLIEIGCAPALVRRHSLGIDPARFPLIPRRLAAGDPIRLVSVARFVEKKGIRYVLEALARVQTTAPIEYTIVGDGSRRDLLETLARAVRPTVRVRFAGWLKQDDVAEVLGRSHVLVAPSVTAADGDQEGTPVSLMEAMASGLPVISTWHSGIPEFVEDGLSGRLVPERDAESLARAIDELAAAPGRWVQMGLAGRARIDRDHDIQKLNDDLVRLYEEILSARSLGATADTGVRLH
jgi:colanic acid/amylovoran biosynthesis glycosyltransferase